MQALILAGGKGTRLRPLTENLPKPIVPIGNEPFLLRQIQSLKNAGVTDIILSTGYQPLAIERALGDGSDYGVKLKYLVEPTPLGTAGAYKFAERFLHTSTIVLNGDILTDINLKEVAAQHRRYNSTATIVLTPVDNPAAYGLVETDTENRVIRFLEKPKAEDLAKIKINTINAGIYVLETRVLDYIPAGENHSFEYQLFPCLLKNRENFHAFIAEDNYWLDIGTPQRYLQAHHDLIAGKIKNLQITKSNNFKSSNEAEVDGRSWIAEGCVIKPKARVINSVLGKGVVIEENSIVQNSVIWSGTKVSSHSSVVDSIIGSNCQIGKNVLLAPGAVLGDQTVIANQPCY
jgi:mannose-1-phosphate guanylyltransferase